VRNSRAKTKVRGEGGAPWQTHMPCSLWRVHAGEEKCEEEGVVDRNHHVLTATPLPLQQLGQG